MITSYPKQQRLTYLPGPYFSIADIVEAMNNLIQERNNHRDTCITIKISRVTQKNKSVFGEGKSSLAIFSTDMGHFLEEM